MPTPHPATAPPLASLLHHLLTHQITLPTAKSLLPRIFPPDPSAYSPPNIPLILTSENLRLRPLSDAELLTLARDAVAANEGMARKVREEVQASAGGGGGGGGSGGTRGKGKIMWFVGVVVRMGEEGRVQPERAEGAVRLALGLD